MTEYKLIVKQRKYGTGTAMDYTLKVYQQLDEDTVIIDGVKYQKVEEPKPTILYDMICEWWGEDETKQVCDDLLSIIEKWLPKKFQAYTEFESGWNECIDNLKERLRE